MLNYVVLYTQTLIECILKEWGDPLFCLYYHGGGLNSMEKKTSKNSVVDKVYQIAKPIAVAQNIDIWDIRFLKEGSNWYLRIFLDKPEGVTIDDCEKFSRAIDKPLDELDPISVPYSLEVCSPGLERELVTDEHFKRYIGSAVKLKTIRPYEDKKRELNGILKSYENNLVTIKNNSDELFEINKKDIAFVKLDDFDL